MNFDEAGVIAALARIFGSSQRGVEIGIGDDAAVVKTSERTAITTDIAVEGTHFNTEWSSAFDIGRKITAANLADVYAMGGSPRFLVAAVTLTGQESMEWIEDLAEGIAIGDAIEAEGADQQVQVQRILHAQQFFLHRIADGIEQFAVAATQAAARVVDLGLVHFHRGTAYAQCGAAYHRHDDRIERSVQDLQLIDRLVRVFRTVVGHHHFHCSLPIGDARRCAGLCIIRGGHGERQFSGGSNP